MLIDLWQKMKIENPQKSQETRRWRYSAGFSPAKPLRALIREKSSETRRTRRSG
jgi:hypothetical protein